MKTRCRTGGIQDLVEAAELTGGTSDRRDGKYRWVRRQRNDPWLRRVEPKAARTEFDDAGDGAHSWAVRRQMGMEMLGGVGRVT